MNIGGIIITIVLCSTVLVLPRRYAFVPPFIATCYITQGQVLDIAGANFTALRLVFLFSFIRVLLRKELQQIEFILMDKIFILWVSSATVIYIILWQTQSAFIYKMGVAYDAILIYFFFRSVFRDLEDVKRAIPIMAVLIVPLAILMLYERFGLKNVFSYFGGVPDTPIFDRVRTRAEGAFRHPILAGSVASCLFPMFMGMWFFNKKKSVLGLMAAGAMIIAANSSGPVMSVIFAIFAMAIWPMHAHMRIIRWGIAASLVALHFVMTAPVWYIIARLSLITGGTGWHRSYLIDRAICYFDDWWLLGTKETSHWMPTKLIIYDAADITNFFIAQGVRGGLLTLILFIALFVFAFSNIGKTIKNTDKSEFISLIFVWSIGASLFAHMVSFISVSYFDQSIVFFYLTLALIGAVTMKILPPPTKPAEDQ